MKTKISDDCSVPLSKLLSFDWRKTLTGTDGAISFQCSLRIVSASPGLEKLPAKTFLIPSITGKPGTYEHKYLPIFSLYPISESKEDHTLLLKSVLKSSESSSAMISFDDEVAAGVFKLNPELASCGRCRSVKECN